MPIKIPPKKHNLTGVTARLNGYLRNIWGDAANIHGFVTADITGDVTWLKGDVTGLIGVVTSITGDVTALKGDVTDLRGDVSGLKGLATGLRGLATGLKGDLDKISSEDRAKHPNITHWLKQAS